MGQVNQISEPVIGLKSIGLSDLAELYDGTINELQLCAKVIPELNLNDPAADLREASFAGS